MLSFLFSNFSLQQVDKDKELLDEKRKELQEKCNLANKGAKRENINFDGVPYVSKSDYVMTQGANSFEYFPWLLAGQTDVVAQFFNNKRSMKKTSNFTIIEDNGKY